jgi:hypothetical protein
VIKTDEWVDRLKEQKEGRNKERQKDKRKFRVQIKTNKINIYVMKKQTSKMK